MAAVSVALDGGRCISMEVVGGEGGGLGDNTVSSESPESNRSVGP